MSILQKYSIVLAKIVFIVLFIANPFTNKLLSQNNYSLFWNSELRLNPALTGVMPTKWRVNELYRNLKLNDNVIMNRNTLSADFKKNFSKQVGSYGVQAVESTGNAIGIGIVDDRIRSDSSLAEFTSDCFSLAFSKKIKKSSVSFGIQPAYLRNAENKRFDLNAGFLWGRDIVTCWQEDQYFKYQFGFSAYNILSNWKDSTLFCGREVQAHGGFLLDKYKKISFVVNAYYKYDAENHISIGTYALFFPRVHYMFFDRARLGLHYRTSNHLTFSAGTRFYGAGKKTFAVDAVISYDMPMNFIDLESTYKRGIEIGLVLYVFEKCWSLSSCGN